jgi:hypothetical protein
MQLDQIAVVATLIKFLLDGIKAAFPTLQGRWTQLVVLILSIVAGVVLMGFKEPFVFLQFVVAVATSAVGVDQILKKAPGNAS